jgi:hypothetical protein
VARALLFVVTGSAFMAAWILVGPGTPTTEVMQQWPVVLGFSAALATLAVAVPVFGRMVGGTSVRRLSRLAGVLVAGLAAINILEDGFRIDEMFIAFVAGLLAAEVTLAALAVAIIRSASRSTRLFGLVPAATLVSVILFPVLGGPLMLVVWTAAASGAVGLARRTRAAGLAESVMP